MRTILPFLLVLVCKLAFAQSSPPNDLEGVELRSWLKENWHDNQHVELGYSEARRQMYSQIDVRADDRVYGVYTGYSQPAANTTFLDPINCEHTVPQSFFGEAEPMKSDIHHLFPAHETANTARLNYAYGDIPDQLTDLWYGADAGNTFVETPTIPEALNTFSESEAGRFEPREDHKGDVARAIFYYYTMYPGTAGDISRIVVGGKVEALYAWHLQDPVSDWERQRNDRIEAVQGDRNPYIDYPDLVCRAFNFTCSDAFISLRNSLPEFSAYTNEPSTTFAASLLAVGNFTEVNLSAGKGFSLTKDGNTYQKELVLTAEEANNTNVGIRFDTSGVAEGTYSAPLTATVNGSATQLASLGGVVLAAGESKLLLFEDFEDANWEIRDWEVISKSSNRNWGYTEEGYAGSPGIEMNGYNGNEGSNDWLISPALNLPAEATHIQFQAYSRYGGEDALKLLVSENYVPGTDPATATWKPLSNTLPDGGSRAWKNAQASLSQYQDKTVYVAFHYQASSNYPSWVIDNFKVLTGEVVIPYVLTISSADQAVEAKTAASISLEVSLDRPAEEDLQLSFSYAENGTLPEPISTQPEMVGGELLLSIPAGSSTASATIDAPAYELEAPITVSFSLQENSKLEIEGRNTFSITFKEYVIAPYTASISPAAVQVKAEADTSFTFEVALERAAEKDVTLSLQYTESIALPEALVTQPAMVDKQLQLSIPAGETTASFQVQAPAFRLEQEQSVSFSIQPSDQIAEKASATITFLPYEEVVQGVAQTDLREWQIGPNPTSGLLYVKSQAKQLASVQLVSATGQQFKVQKPDAEGRLDLAQLPAGMYLLLLQEVNGNTTQIRIIKQ